MFGISLKNKGTVHMQSCKKSAVVHLDPNSAKANDIGRVGMGYEVLVCGEYENAL